MILRSHIRLVHEIKHDGYRLIARRTDNRVRLYTRRGFNWAGYPLIVEALRSLRARSITVDPAKEISQDEAPARLPEGCVDVTFEQSAKTCAIVAAKG